LNQSWNTFGQVAGDASGALVGLLFVSVSLNRERIVKSDILRVGNARKLNTFDGEK